MTDKMAARPMTLARRHARAAEVESIAARHGLSNVRVFGSVARGTADERSDLDLLVDAEPGTGLFALSAFAGEVEDLLGVPTQVATMHGLKARIRSRVEGERPFRYER